MQSLDTRAQPGTQGCRQEMGTQTLDVKDITGSTDSFYSHTNEKILATGVAIDIYLRTS